MKIQKVIIDNFRNIKHAEYDLKDMNIFAGPNGVGKSNTLLAIYLLLNDYLLDGSSDDASNKPLDRDQKTKTAVELIFEDGWSIKKEYYENWVKKQSTKEVVMEGNVTQYYIRGDKVKIKEAREQLLERLQLDVKTTTSNFDLTLAMTDPSYIGSKVDNKVLRSFIIDLVGDIKNEDVYATDPLFIKVKELINEYDNDPSLVIKSLKKKITACKEDVESKSGAIEALSDVEDVSTKELEEAKHKIYGIEDNIAIYRQQKVTSVNQIIQNLEKDLTNKKLELSQSISSDSDFMVNQNSGLNFQIDVKRDEYKNKRKEIESINNERFHADHAKRMLETEIPNLQKELDTKETLIDISRIEYGEISNSKFINNIVLPEKVNCPECGYLLNSDAMDSIRKNIEDNRKMFETEKFEKLEANKKNGKQLKLDIENLRIKLVNKKSELDKNMKIIEDCDCKLKLIGDAARIIEDEGNELKSKLITAYESETTKKLKSDVAMLTRKLEIEKQSDNTEQTIQDKINACIEERKPFDEIVSKHNMFIQTQKEIQRIEKEIDYLLTSQTEHEQQLSICSDFMKTKLAMLNKNVQTVFGERVTFTLVKANIKEGSWDEVCYPSVIDKETPFKHGSESERIRTGIYMIECIKKKLNIPDVPIIFDRSNDLDSNNLSNLETKSQIITTRVDDVNFNEVTLVHQ